MTFFNRAITAVLLCFIVLIPVAQAEESEHKPDIFAALISIIETNPKIGATAYFYQVNSTGEIIDEKYVVSLNDVQFMPQKGYDCFTAEVSYGIKNINAPHGFIPEDHFEIDTQCNIDGTWQSADFILHPKPNHRQHGPTQLAHSN